MAEGLGTGGRQAIVLVFGRKQRQRVATGVGAVLIAAGVVGIATGSVPVPVAGETGRAQAAAPASTPVNVFDIAASPTKTWTVPSDGVQIIEVVEFVGSGGFGGDSFSDLGTGVTTRLGGNPCRVHSSGAVTTGGTYKAHIGERGGDGSLDITDPDTNNSRRPGGAGGQGYHASFGTYGQSGGKGGASYIGLNPLNPGWIQAGGGGGGGATAIVEASGYPVFLIAAGGGGASANLAVSQGAGSCSGGSSTSFGLGNNACTSGTTFCGGGGTWSAGGAGGTNQVSGRLCRPPATGTGISRASTGYVGGTYQLKGIGGDGAIGLATLCNVSFGTAGGAGGGGGATGGGGGASYADNGGGGPGGTGSSRGGSKFNSATTATVGSAAYVRWATIDTDVVATGAHGPPYSPTLSATFGDPAVPFYATAAWKWTATGLPAGWTIGATTGVLSGALPATPTTITVSVEYISSYQQVAKTSRKYTVGGASGVSVTAKNATSVYGADVAAVGYDTLGLTADDWFVSMNCGAFEDAAGTTPVTSSTKPGTYSTVCTGPVSSGLGKPVTYTNGTYTVTKAPLTITAKSFTKTYGDVLTLDGATDFTATGLVGSDTVDSVTLTTSGDVASATATGSPYNVVPSAAVGGASQVLADWYTITYANGAITVNKAPALSVTPKTYTIGVGDTSLDSGTLGFDVTGFVNSETFASTGYTAPTCAVYDGAALVSPPYSALVPGTYTLKCSGGVAGGYADITYSESKFVIKAADVAVTAKNASSTYGTAPDADTGYEVAGGLNGVTVTCKAYVSYTDAATNEPVTASTKPGTYLTVCTGASDNGAPDNTPITYTDGEYTVNKAPLTLSAESHTKTYGEVINLDADLSDGSTDVTVTGLVNSDDVDSVTLTSSGDVGTAGVSGSPYSVVPSGAVGAASQVLTDFYDITYVDGTITVSKKTLTITADDVSLETGASVPTSYDFTATGWENGEDDTTNLPDGWAAPTCESSFNSTTPPGTPVDIVCSGGSADDYEFSFTKGTATIGDAEIAVENTTARYFQTSTYTAAVTLSASLVGGGKWSPGCLVTFTLSPSQEAGGPYFAYPSADQITNGTPVTVDAVLPIGAYGIVTTLSGNCAADGAIDDGYVVISPNGPTGAAHVDTYGTRYFDLTTSTTVTLNMEWLRKLVRTKNPTTGLYETTWVNSSYYNWSIYGGNQWRIASKPFAGTVTISDGDPTSPQTATVSTWGRMACPDGMYPAGNASICSAVTNIVMLQEWVPRPSNPKYGTWRNIGEVLIVEKLAEGRWPYRCRTVACKTPLPDYVAFQMRPVPGSATPTAIPIGFPAYTDWTRVTYGKVMHK